MCNLLLVEVKHKVLQKKENYELQNMFLYIRFDCIPPLIRVPLNIEIFDI